MSEQKLAGLGSMPGPSNRDLNAMIDSVEYHRLLRIEQLAREVIKAGDNTCGEGRTLADLDRFRQAMDALSAALEGSKA